jgi:hypothetical protein
MAEVTTQPLPKAPTMAVAPLDPTKLEHPLTSPEPNYLEPQYESPLYTEINIPLPPLPGTPVTTATPITPVGPTSPKSSRSRAHTLHSFSPFHRRRSSSPSASIPEIEYGPKKHQEKRIELSMRDVSKGRKKRSGTVGAAIVPAVMVLSAELFTPGEGASGNDMEPGKDRLEVLR